MVLCDERSVGLISFPREDVIIGLSPVEKRRRAIGVAVVAALLLPAAYMAWREREMAHFGFPHDDGIYYVTAKSLAQGSGYRILSLPGAPLQTKYPPLLPLGLSLVWRSAPEFPANLRWATLFAWVWLPIWLALAFRLLRNLGLGWGAAVGLCGAITLNHHVAHFAMRTQPELMFAALWTASAALVTARPKSVGLAIVAGALAAAAYLTKTAALPILAAAPLYYALRRQQRNAVAFALAMLPWIAIWNVWTHAHLARSTDWLRMYYTDYLGYHLFTVTLETYPRIVLTNLDALLSSLGALLLGWASEPGILERAAGALVLMGTIRHWRRGGTTLYHLFAFGYIALLVVWHYPPDARFLLPVFPVLLAGLWTEMRELYSTFRRHSRAASAIFAAACVLFLLYWCVAGWARFSAYFEDFRAMRARCYGPAYQWIARDTPLDSAFLASEDALLYLYTGRQAVTPIVPMRYFYQRDGEGVVQLVKSRPAIARDHGLGYILDAPRDWWRELLPNPRAVSREASRLLARSPEAERVYGAGGCSVYAVKTPGFRPPG